jgi:diadenosine tetraphosphatase ApaH/serine/threonine PP2A family protein phosphatase
MGCHILEGRETPDGAEMACFYCSTTGTAFGPIMQNREEAEKFLEFCHGDPRYYSQRELMDKYSDFTKQFVCLCGHVRGQDYEDEEPEDGDRFVCPWCKLAIGGGAA